ncbi:MAG: Diguanylate cyclase DgcZ [Luteibacter sp.]|uniref:GGDEF domain-containing protein n=1 Tax=Luteibacter sp. TaxID=1886636 RepID=UPI00137DC269|nr:GGDEF domain-containing protein [Luteibacter sp.]KAF1003985.1 MAG: Diguanylate cyclase DgcZ [Luteibacter sp.]
MERDEHDFRQVEENLRRLALRLALLARGQSTDADALLDRLTSSLHAASSGESLDPLLDDLSAVVAALDVPRGADDPDSVAALREDIARLQDLLAEVGTRLGDVTRFLAGGMREAEEGEDQTRSLDARVHVEMKLLEEQVAAATDLSGLRAQVSERLSMIDVHFREHREREDARLAAYRDGARRMRHRVEELETQATTLQDSLRREHERALTDPLTELPNRLAWERRMEDVESDVRAGGMACLAAFDIDHFKAINDTYGHAAGDAVLRIVGRTLAQILGDDTFVARYGGEEFVVVFVGRDTDAALASSVALCAAVAKLAFHAGGKPVTVTMSGGITRFDARDTAITAFERSDRALYAAKRAGRDRCLVG